ATFTVTDATYSGVYTWEVYYDNGTPLNYADDTLLDNDNSSIRLTTIGLAAGDYYVSFAQVGLPTCENREPFSIAGPDAAITASTVKTEITCNPTDNGIIQIIDVAGGWGGYTYYVGLTPPTAPGDFVADPRFDGLDANTYQAWVRDANGCETMVEDDIVLVDPTPITADLQINVENCSNFEGVIEVIDVLGGQGSNYSYQLEHWDGSDFVNTRPLQTNAVFSGLGAGQYRVIVSDQWGCTGTTTASVTLYEEMIPDVDVVKLIDCTVDPGGQITISQTGGTGPFTYTGTFPDGSALTPNTDGVFTVLVP